MEAGAGGGGDSTQSGDFRPALFCYLWTAQEAVVGACRTACYAAMDVGELADAERALLAAAACAEPRGAPDITVLAEDFAEVARLCGHAAGCGGIWHEMG